MAYYFSDKATGPRNLAGGVGAYSNGTPTYSRGTTLWQRENEQYIQSPDALHEPRHGWTQDDQNRADDEAHRKALDSLIQSWNDRLSSITVITTFFAATEAQLLSSAAPANKYSSSAIEKVTNAGLTGALVVHVFSALFSFLAAFFLIRYKLKEATKLELETEAGVSDTQSGASGSPSYPDVFARNPHLIKVGPFAGREPPINLLRRCHSFCMWLAAIGFSLALTGVVSFVWQTMPLSVSIFSSVLAGVCVVAGLAVVL